MRVPHPVVPLGHWRNRLVALDLGAEAAFRRRPLPVVARDGDTWTPLKTPVTPRDATFHERATRASAEREAGRPAAELAQLVEALRRPLYTAYDLDEIVGVQRRLLELAASQGADPQVRRLAEAGVDPQRWHAAGAERAIAGRIREALVGLQGAAYLWRRAGSQRAWPSALRDALAHTYQRAGWAWAHTLLALLGHGR